MLFGELYTIEEKESDESAETQFKYKIKINKTHKIFEGHFPGQPVLPGVCQIEIVNELLNQIKGVDLWLTNASNIKYIDIVNPNENEFIYLKLSINQTPEGIKVSAVSTFEDGELNFKFSGVFRQL